MAHTNDHPATGSTRTSSSMTGRGIQRQTPENHQLKIGEFDITVVSDGYIAIPTDILLSNANPTERQAFLPLLDIANGTVKPKANIPLIRSGSDLVLVDIGGGDKFQETDGRLVENLQHAGIDRESITKVVFSHAHPDHIWATLTIDGGLLYPNATYYIGAAEWDFWMNPDFESAMPLPLHDFARGAQRDLNAIRERVVMLHPGDEILTGFRALDTPGHTPGHLSFELAGGDGLLIAVDVANNEIVSFRHPDWTFGYDTDPELAIRTRQRFLDRATTDRIRLLGYHWAYPGVGYAERDGRGYRFLASP